MYKKVLCVCLLVLVASFSYSQNNEWKNYFSNNEVSIEFKYTECHNPSKGIHHENVLLRITNKTNNELVAAYYLQRIYNGKEVKADVSNFTFSLTANTSIESSCDELKEGLYVFSRILDLKANSVLNSFDLKNLTINGQPVAR
ncbi:MAG: hypothetical protein POELPBGB_00968 [Bacteroidia bacterium]|nr:hypothetical protein [Bacteroidia bacterium]